MTALRAVLRASDKIELRFGPLAFWVKGFGFRARRWFGA